MFNVCVYNHVSITSAQSNLKVSSNPVLFIHNLSREIERLLMTAEQWRE